MTKHWMQAAINQLGVPLSHSPDLEHHQATAAARLVDTLMTFGGALLADVVGLGKTRTAVHAAIRTRRRRGDPRKICFVAPARLLPAWRDAAQHAGLLPSEFVVWSHTALSRGQRPQGGASVVVVDEAHHFRNPQTRRTEHLARICDGVPTLLVSATPVINSVWDLYHLLNLFLAEQDTLPWLGRSLRHAFEDAAQGRFDLTELLGRICVRRHHGSGAMATRPDVELRILTYTPGPHELWLWRHLEPTLHTLSLQLLLDDWPRSLFTDHLLRVWEGGAHALCASLTQLAAFHERWLELHTQGRKLERREFAGQFGEDGAQAVFAFMFAQEDAGVSASDVESDFRTLSALRDRAHAAANERNGFQGALAGLLRDGEKCLVFANYQRAAKGLYAALRHNLGSQAKLGLVTGSHAEATGIGRTTAHEVLTRFSPNSHQRRLEPHEEIDVLVCTDCLSEGVNLQDCGRMVFVDLPWTPHGVEQRIGRLVRPGARAHVEVWLPRPDVWRDTLGLRQRIATKARHAEVTGTGYTLASTTTSSPLDTLTALDGMLDGKFDASTVPRHARHSGAQRWLLLRVRHGDQTVLRLARQVGDRWEHNLAKNLPAMAECLLQSGPVEAVAEAPEWARDEAKRLWEELQGATMAPPHLADVQLHTWKRLQNETDVPTCERLRSHVLRPLTRAQLGWLSRAIEGPITPIVATLARWDPWEDTVCVEVVGTLDSAGRPFQRASTQNMHVEVEDRLPG